MSPTHLYYCAEQVSHHPPGWSDKLGSLSNTCPYHRNLFCCSINIISSVPSLSLNSLLGTLSFTLTLHIYLTILISARWSATSFSFLTGQVSLPCSILLRTQLLYSLPLLINDISILVSHGTKCLNLFHPIGLSSSTSCRSATSFEPVCDQIAEREENEKKRITYLKLNYVKHKHLLHGELLWFIILPQI